MKIKDLKECVDINDVVDADFYLKMKGSNGLDELVFVKFVEDYKALNDNDIVIVSENYEDRESLKLKRVVKCGDIIQLRDRYNITAPIDLSDDIEIVGKANYKICEMV